MTDTGKKVLIIEDEDLTRMALKKKLESEGFLVVTAVDGTEGLKLALAEHPDLILLDMILPIMDGATVLENLRKDNWGRSALVIVLSNLNRASAFDGDKEMGIRQYLVKTNWKLADVVETVKKELGISI